MQWSDKRKREELPIDSKLEYILKELEKNQVLICEAETGAGKTTRIPQAALLADPKLKILMTQPRRSACRWIGKRIASELGCNPGEIVGWHLVGEKPKISKNTRLELIVDQSLINRIRRKGILPEGLIIVDEAHERSLSIDLLLGLIKEKLEDSPNTRLLITSATIDAKKFSCFFNDAPIVSVEGRCFQVREEVFPLTRGEHHTEGAARASHVILEQFLQQKLVIPDGHNGQKIVEQGVVLVLLPGKEDIHFVKQTLLDGVKYHEAFNQIQVLSCHGESSAEEQDQVQKTLPKNTLRFVCCTELLRTSITIPETIGVIDSLQVKRFFINSNGVACLDKIPISKAEANQAKGRAGRTGPGFYMPVSFESEYSEYYTLTEWPQPAILREPVTHIALQVADIDRSIRNFSFIDMPPQDKIELAMSRLKAIAALTHEEKITENGKSLLHFPLDPELAMVLLTADKLNVLAEAIIVTSVLEDNSFFISGNPDDTIIVDKGLLKQILDDDASLDDLPDWVCQKGEYFEVKCGEPSFPKPEGARWLRDCLRKTWAGKSKSDFTAIVRAYRAFKAEEQQHKKSNFRSRQAVNKILEKYLNDWCFARGLNLKKIRLAEDKMFQIQESLVSSPLKSTFELSMEHSFDEAALTKAIITGKIDHIAYNCGNSEFSSKLGDFKLNYASSCPCDTPFVLVGSLRKIHKSSRRREPTYLLLADYAAPVEIGWLYEIAPQFCVKKRMKNYYYDHKKDVVMETEMSYFNEDIELDSKEVPAKNKQAKKFIACFLAKQCLQSQFQFQLTNNELNDAITHNFNQQKLAKELNQLAGQQYFTVYSLEELTEIFVNAISDVAHLRDLTSEHINAIYLPELDKKLISEISLYNPLAIRIQSINLEVKVEYTSSSKYPQVTLEEEHMVGNWLKFLEERPRLPNRVIEVKIHRKSRPSFMLNWDSSGRADLSGVDLSNILFIQGNLLTSFSPTVSELNILPNFLSKNVFDKEEKLHQALNSFCYYTIEPPQLKFIQWSIAMQVIRMSLELDTTSYLEVLKKHALMKQENYLSKLSGTLSSLIKPFWNINERTIYLDQKIDEAIRSINSLRYFPRKYANY